MNKRNSITSPFQISPSNTPDIIALQEPSQSITDSSTPIHAEFLANVKRNVYTAHINTHSITQFNLHSLSPLYTNTFSPIDEGRIQTHIFTIRPDTHLAVLNIYAYQQSHQTYHTSSSTILTKLSTHFTKPKSLYPNFHILALGDLNVDPTSLNPTPNNVLKFLTTDLINLTSAIPYLSTTLPLPKTHASGSHIDHCLISHDLLPTLSSAEVNTSFTSGTAPSDHSPCHITINIDVIKEKLPFTPLHDVPNYKCLSSIPITLTKGACPSRLDKENRPWFNPDRTLLNTNEYNSAITTISKLKLRVHAAVSQLRQHGR
jgi:exonuclease III